MKIDIEKINKELELKIFEFDNNYWFTKEDVKDICGWKSDKGIKTNSDKLGKENFSGERLKQIRANFGELLTILPETNERSFFHFETFINFAKNVQTVKAKKLCELVEKNKYTNLAANNHLAANKDTISTDYSIECLNPTPENISIKFIIKNLGAINRESEIEYKSFMVLSGESGVGKSYTAFAIHYLNVMFQTDHPDFSVSKMLNSIIKLNDIKQQIISNGEVTFKIHTQSIENYFSESVNNYLKYILNHYELSSEISIKFQNIDELEYKVSYKARVWNETDFAKLLWNDIANQLIGRNQKSILLPPGRGVVIDMPKTSFDYLQAGMYKEFGRDKDWLGSPRFEPNKQKDELLEKLLTNLFKGEIKAYGTKLTYKFGNQEIPLSAAASSIKEIAPLFLLLKNPDYQNVSVLIEEPEAHLHPALQRKTALLIAYLISKGTHVQITTHSSYFLNQINNLIKLSYIKGKNKDEFDKLIAKLNINENLLISPENVGAYHFARKNGDIEIVKQDLSTEAIPFDTFEDTVKQMFDETDDINDKFYE